MDNDSTDDIIETEIIEAAGSAVIRTEAIVDELLIEEISIDGMCGVY